MPWGPHATWGWRSSITPCGWTGRGSITPCGWTRKGYSLLYYPLFLIGKKVLAFWGLHFLSGTKVKSNLINIILLLFVSCFILKLVPKYGSCILVSFQLWSKFSPIRSLKRTGWVGYRHPNCIHFLLWLLKEENQSYSIFLWCHSRSESVMLSLLFKQHYSCDIVSSSILPLFLYPLFYIFNLFICNKNLLYSLNKPY